MTLEYFKPETFRKISEWQIEQEGTPKELRDVEVFLSEETKKSKPALSAQLQSWLTDEEIKDWFNSEPYLSDIDLRPYFYFSRDKLDSISAYVQRLSPIAQEIFTQLISDSKAERKLGIDKIKNISPADGTALFEATKERFLEKDDISNGITLLIDMTSEQMNLASQLFTFLEDLPTTKIKTSIIPKLIKATNTSETQNYLLVILQKWGKDDSNKAFSKIANKQLQKIKPELNGNI